MFIDLPNLLSNPTWKLRQGGTRRFLVTKGLAKVKEDESAVPGGDGHVEGSMTLVQNEEAVDRGCIDNRSINR